MNIKSNPFLINYWVVPLIRQQKLTYLQKEAIANEIISKVCSYYNISNANIKSKNRAREIVLPRHMAIYLIRNKVGLKYKDIADMFGNKDHTTVMHAIKNITNYASYDENIINDIKNLINII